MNHKLKNSLLVGSIVGALLCGAQDGYAENALESMISPVTNPLNFEDPRILTEIRPVYAYHRLNDDFITGGGDVQLVAAQARIALTDRLALIATKDGYFQINSDRVLDDSEGSANLEAGLKYALLQDAEAGRILSAGLRYQLASGSPKVFQGNGDGIVTPFLSGGMKMGEVNLLASTELRMAIDSADTTFWDLSLHADLPMGSFYPLIEVNMYHVVDAGNRIPLQGEGADVINFGSSRTDGKTTVTLGAGARYRVATWFDLGAAYETALTDNEDVFDWRVTTDAIFRFSI